MSGLTTGADPFWIVSGLTTGADPFWIVSGLTTGADPFWIVSGLTTGADPFWIVSGFTTGADPFWIVSGLTTGAGSASLKIRLFFSSKNAVKIWVGSGSEYGFGSPKNSQQDPELISPDPQHCLPVPHGGYHNNSDENQNNVKNKFY